MEQLYLNEQTVTINEQLLTLVQSLEPIQMTLEKNSYVKDTTKKLKRLIEDGSANTIVLVMGKERVGKTSLINSLLGRDILPTNYKYPTSINTFIKYSDTQEIRAHFLDGMVASFDMSKMEIFTTSDSFIAEIIRQHIDYIEIYLTNDVLKQLTIIDSVALELSGTESAFVSEMLLNRADEIIWVIRANTGLTQPEMYLLEKFVNRGLSPHLIVNAIDEVTTNRHETIKTLREQLTPFVNTFTAISARNAIEAKKKNDMQLLIDSQFVELQRLFEQILNNQSQKQIRVIDRLIQWLDIFYVEVKYLLTREPLVSARQRLESVTGGESFEYTRTQRDMAILDAYADEYKIASKVFKDVQTLYQLLTLLTKEIHLRDESIEYFEGVAVSYQKSVREYRKMHVDYMQSYGVLDSKIRKNMGVSIDAIDLQKHSTSEIVSLLNKYQELAKLRQHIEDLEAQVVDLLPLVTKHLNELALQKLESILTKSQDVNHYRKVEVQYLASYNRKVEEFECVEEAQKMLLEQVKPVVLDEAIPIAPNKRNELALLFDKMADIELGISSLQVELPKKEQVKDQSIAITFDQDYPLMLLKLEKEDVVSDIPDLPQMIGKQS